MPFVFRKRSTRPTAAAAGAAVVDRAVQSVLEPLESRRLFAVTAAFDDSCPSSWEFQFWRGVRLWKVYK